MKLLIERGILFKPTKKTIINESNAAQELPSTVYDYVKLDNGKTLLKVEGILADYVNENGNGRFYSEEVWNHVLESQQHIMKDIKEHNAWGILEHPSDGETRLGDVSHRILSVKKDGTGHIIGEVLIVDTSAGRDLRALLESGGTAGISSRGWGDTVERNAREEVLPGYVCETWDFVKVNSVSSARFNTSVNAAQASGAAQDLVKEESIDKNNQDLSESEKTKTNEPVISNNESTPVTNSNNLTESTKMKEFNRNALDLEVSQLKSIAESKTMDLDQLQSVLATAENSVTSISEGVEEKKITKADADKLIARYTKVVESANNNSPASRELEELKLENKSVQKRYEALKKVSTGVLERFNALKSDYVNIDAESTKESKEDKKTVLEADVRKSKRYKALLSVSEELMKRTVQSGKVLEKAKSRAEGMSEGQVAVLGAKLEALKQDLPEKAVLLIHKCESKEQIEKVLLRVQELNKVNEEKNKCSKAKEEEDKKKEDKKEEKVESQAHKEPLPGDKVNEGTENSKKVELHESVGLMSRLRQTQK